MITAPCKNCIRKHVGCHASCQDYITYQKENDKHKEVVKKRKNLDHAGASVEAICFYHLCKLGNNHKK